MIYKNILDAIGNTPLVRLSKIVPENAAQILVKYEGLNVGGSVKTRTAYNMICEAEKQGKIHADTKELELTSGLHIPMMDISEIKGELFWDF